MRLRQLTGIALSAGLIALTLAWTIAGRPAPEIRPSATSTPELISAPPAAVEAARLARGGKRITYAETTAVGDGLRLLCLDSERCALYSTKPSERQIIAGPRAELIRLLKGGEGR